MAAEHPSVDRSPVWFITGAASGLGRALAEHAVDHGHRVVATARNCQRLAPLRQTASDRVLLLELDVTDSVAVGSVVDEAWEQFGGVDFVVNNAGSAFRAPLEATPEDELRRLFETNFFGAVHVMRAFLPHLRRQGHGHFVSVSSLSGDAAVPGRSAYAATKYALEGLSATMAAELAMFGLGITIVQPGGFTTDLLVRAPTLPRLDEYARLYEVMSRPVTSDGPSSPNTGAAAMFEALTSPAPPLRLPLRSSCAQYIRHSLEEQLREYEEWDHVIRIADPQ